MDCERCPSGEKSSSSSSDLSLGEGDLLSTGTCYYQVQATLGYGVFGEAFRCRNTVTNETVAIKVLFNGPSWTISPEREVSMLEKLRCLDPDQCHIVEWYYVFQHKHTFCFVFELLDINLWDIMDDLASLPLKDIRHITQQLATALNALKTIGVIHTDLKPDNIMVTDRHQRPLNIKIIDFGLAITTSEAKPDSKLQPCSYRAPEIFLGLPFSEAIDMWSVGCVLAFLVLGGHLYHGWSEYDVFRRIVETQGQPADELLCAGPYTSVFFTKKTPGPWMFMTPEEYELETGIKPQVCNENRVNSLDELKKFIIEKDLAEEEDKSAFVDLVKQMLHLDAGKRITPGEVLAHRFMTMSMDDNHHSSHVKSTFPANEHLQSTLEEEDEATPGEDLDQGETGFLPDFNPDAFRPIPLRFFERLTEEQREAVDAAVYDDKLKQEVKDMCDEVLYFVSKATIEVFLPAIKRFTRIYGIVSPVSTKDSSDGFSSDRSTPTGSQKGVLELSSDNNLPGQPLYVDAAAATPVIEDMDQLDSVEKAWEAVSLMVDNIMEMTGPEEEAVADSPATLVSFLNRMYGLLSSKATALHKITVWKMLTDRVYQLIEDQHQEIQDLFLVAGRTMLYSNLQGRMGEVVEGTSMDLTNKLIYLFAEETVERLLQQFLGFLPSDASCMIAVMDKQEGPWDCSESNDMRSDRTSPLPSPDSDEAEDSEVNDGDTEDVQQSEMKDKRKKFNFLFGLFSKCSKKDNNNDPTEYDIGQSKERRSKGFLCFLCGLCSKRSNRIHPEDQACAGSKTESLEDQEYASSSIPVKMESRQHPEATTSTTKILMKKKLSIKDKVVAFFSKAKKSTHDC